MSSVGRAEDKVLKKNVAAQVARLKQQLEDLDSFRDALEDDEYEETKATTVTQLAEFEEVLAKMTAGHMTLVDRFGHNRLAIQEAIRAAFKTPEVIKMFAQKQPRALRQRLQEIQRDHKLGRVDADSFKDEAVEIIVALKNLGEKLTTQEKKFLDSSSDLMAKFESADKAIGANVMAAAKSGVRGAT